MYHYDDDDNNDKTACDRCDHDDNAKNDKKMLSMFYHQISLTKKNCPSTWIDDVNHSNVPLGY